MTAILNHQLSAPALNLPPVTRACASVAAAFKSWSAARASARRDAEYWALAQSDYRVMAELQRAMCCQEADPR